MLSICPESSVRSLSDLQCRPITEVSSPDRRIGLSLAALRLFLRPSSEDRLSDCRYRCRRRSVVPLIS